MSTINDKLIRLASYKDDIKAAIIAKGQTVGDNMSLYAEAISKISGGSDEPLPEILDTDPLTFVRVDNSGTPGSIALKDVGNVPAKTFQYNKNDEGWLTYTANEEIPMNYGDKIQFKSTSTTALASSSTAYRNFRTIGGYKCGGDISTLINKSNTLQSYAFAYLFENCNIYSAPILPATTLATYCYRYMFSGCTSLVNAPEQLPATRLADYCYYNMFKDCTSLVNAPALPATTLASYCYQYMFRDCTSLVNAPVLPATTLAPYCYSEMFLDCTSLVNAPALPATTLTSTCYSSMFLGCTSLVNAPALPATTLAGSCYSNMFYGCTSLVNAPALPATTLEYSCYYNMFWDCTSLVNAPALPATTLANLCYYLMFKGCSKLKTIYCNARYSSGTTSITTSISSNWLSGVPNTTDCIFYKNPDWSGPTSRGANTIPSNWLIVNWSQDTPISLADGNLFPKKFKVKTADLLLDQVFEVSAYVNFVDENGDEYHDEYICIGLNGEYDDDGNIIINESNNIGVGPQGGYFYYNIDPSSEWTLFEYDDYGANIEYTIEYMGYSTVPIYKI